MDSSIKPYYIGKVIRDEMNIAPSAVPTWYSPFGGVSRSGRFYTFTREQFGSSQPEQTETESDSYNQFGGEPLPF